MTRARAPVLGLLACITFVGSCGGPDAQTPSVATVVDVGSVFAEPRCDAPSDGFAERLAVADREASERIDPATFCSVVCAWGPKLRVVWGNVGSMHHPEIGTFVDDGARVSPADGADALRAIPPRYEMHLDTPQQAGSWARFYVEHVRRNTYVVTRSAEPRWVNVDAARLEDLLGVDEARRTEAEGKMTIERARSLLRPVEVERRDDGSFAVGCTAVEDNVLHAIRLVLAPDGRVVEEAWQPVVTELPVTRTR